MVIFHGVPPATNAAAVRALAESFHVLCMPTTELLSVLPPGCAAVFLFANRQSENDFSRLQADHPLVPVVLCSAGDADLLKWALGLQMLSIFGIADTSIETRLLPYTRALVTPMAQWGPEMLLGKDAKFHDVPYDPTMHSDLQMDGVIGFFREAGLREEIVGDLRLALTELLNNAVYHGLQHGGTETPTGEDLDTSGRVVVQFGLDDDQALLSVTDSAGALEPSRIAEVLLRHQNSEGLFDLRGRGLYLVRNLADEVYFHLQPGRRTQVTLLFGRHTNPMVKNLQIRLIPPR